MRNWFGWIMLPLALSSDPCAAAGVSTLDLGAVSLKSRQIEKWSVSCATDKTENKSSCSATLNAFDYSPPKQMNLTFAMTANRVDVHVIVVGGACVSYLMIDPPHLKMNTATEIKWRSEKMIAPITISTFHDVAGARLFYDDDHSSLRRALESEGPLYLKTTNADKSVSFSESTKGYTKACQALMGKELAPGR